MWLRPLCIALVAMAVTAAPAGAQMYVSGHIGTNLLSDSEFTDFDGDFVQTEHELGFLVGGEFGYALDLGFRVGGEITYRTNDLDRVNGPGFSVPAGGDMSSLAFMANGWYDFKTKSTIKPYIGGGLGFANVSVSRFNVGGIQVVDDSDTVFAFQFGTGLAFDLNPKMAITADYRYFLTANPDFGLVEGEYVAHSIMVGIRYRL